MDVIDSYQDGQDLTSARSKKKIASTPLEKKTSNADMKHLNQFVLQPYTGDATDKGKKKSSRRNQSQHATRLIMITPTEGGVSTAQPSQGSNFGKSQYSESIRNSLTGMVGEVILGPVEYDESVKNAFK